MAVLNVSQGAMTCGWSQFLTRYQCTLVPTGSFASTLPTYQQSEVMAFIMNKVPLPSTQQSIEAGKAG